MTEQVICKERSACLSDGKAGLEATVWGWRDFIVFLWLFVFGLLDLIKSNKWIDYPQNLFRRHRRFYVPIYRCDDVQFRQI